MNGNGAALADGAGDGAGEGVALGDALGDGLWANVGCVLSAIAASTTRANFFNLNSYGIFENADLFADRLECS